MGQFGHLFKGISAFRTLIYIASSIPFFCITACTSEDTASSWDYKTESRATREFMYNYELLYYYYNDANKYLGDPEDYIGKVPDKALSQYNVPWDYYDVYYMYSQMNDPFTQYVDPFHSSSILASLNSSEEKMDAGFEWKKQSTSNVFIVTNVIKNSPADHAGLKVGDQITAIEGTAPTSEYIFDKLSTGIKDETITYTVLRDSQTLTIPITLGPYYVPTVELAYKDSIPVIKILEFTKQTSDNSGTYGEFTNYLRDTEKYKSTIIDLRDNGGGDGDQCFSISQLLLSRGDSTVGVISTRPDKMREKQAYDTTFRINSFDGFAKDRYYVFLVNNQSASCSEVFLQSVVMNKKYPVVGTTTYGKGIGQATFITPSYALAIITDAKVVDKNFKSYHKYGIVPDFIINDNEQALNKAVQLAKEMTYIRTAGYGTSNTGHFAKAATEPDTMPGFYFLPDEFRKRF